MGWRPATQLADSPGRQVVTTPGGRRCLLSVSGGNTYAFAPRLQYSTSLVECRYKMQYWSAGTHSSDKSRRPPRSRVAGYPTYIDSPWRPHPRHPATGLRLICTAGSKAPPGRSHGGVPVYIPLAALNRHLLRLGHGTRRIRAFSLTRRAKPVVLQAGGGAGRANRRSMSWPPEAVDV